MRKIRLRLYKNITVADSGTLDSQIVFQTALKGFHVFG